MKDYVKCLECGTENAREDSFLDIPLPIRPFGSNTAYKCVVSILRSTEGANVACIVSGTGSFGSRTTPNRFLFATQRSLPTRDGFQRAFSKINVPCPFSRFLRHRRRIYASFVYGLEIVGIERGPLWFDRFLRGLSLCRRKLFGRSLNPSCWRATTNMSAPNATHSATPTKDSSSPASPTF